MTESNRARIRIDERANSNLREIIASIDGLQVEHVTAPNWIYVDVDQEEPIKYLVELLAPHGVEMSHLEIVDPDTPLNYRRTLPPSD